MSNVVKANIIRFIHYLLVIFVVLAPFANHAPILIIHVSLCICLLTHWWSNSDVCSLSVFEAKLRGIEYTKTFMHSIVNGVYNIDDSTISYLCKAGTISLMFVSIYYLYKSGIFGKCNKMWKDSKGDFSKKVKDMSICLFSY